MAPGAAFELLAFVNGTPERVMPVWSLRLGNVALPHPGVQMLQDLGDSTVRFTAPPVKEATPYTIRAQYGDAFAQVTFIVDPAPTLAQLPGQVADLVRDFLDWGNLGPLLHAPTDLPFGTTVPDRLRGPATRVGNGRWFNNDPGEPVVGFDCPVRFNAPFGLALGGPSAFDAATMARLGARFKWVVSDAASHIIRCAYPDSSVETCWGQAEAPGFRDGRLTEARFHGPTFVLALPTSYFDDGPPASEFLVADSGNHAIRRLHGDGRGETVFGTGAPGHHDDLDPLRVTFNDPQGMAHFSDLRGIINHSTQGLLVVVDGNSLRSINLANGMVTTLLGSVQEPGFRDLGAGPGVPCLDHPVDFIDAEGTRTARLQGRGKCEQSIALEGTFNQAGTARVVVTCVTPEGFSFGTFRELSVK